jgi:hypothetical protein
MDRRQALKEGLRSLGQALPLVLGIVAGLKDELQPAGEAGQIGAHIPLPVKPRQKKPVRRDPE